MKKRDVLEESYMDTPSMVYISTELYFVFGTHKNIQGKEN